MPRTRIITNNGSESLFVAQKKKKYGASMRLVSRESEYGSLCSGVPSSPSPKSRYKVVLWFLVFSVKNFINLELGDIVPGLFCSGVPPYPLPLTLIHI